MRRSWIAWGAVVYFVLFAVAVTWPGMIPFNRIEPLILGLPFSMAWVAIWVAGAFLVLLLVDRAHEKEDDGKGGR